MSRKIPAQPSTPTFRVIKLSDVAKDRVRSARDAKKSTNKDFIDEAVAGQLDSLLEELAAVGIEPLGNGGPVRLPFSDHTLALLKEASSQVSIPAVALLRICLRRHADTILSAAPKRGRRSSKKGGK